MPESRGPARAAAAGDPAAPPPANRRVQALAVVVFAAIVAVVAIVIVSGRPEGQMSAAHGAAQTQKLLAGVEQHGTTLGAPNAPVTIVEFVDLQCPYCAAHQVDQQPSVINRVVRTGQAKITIAPLAFLGPDSKVGRAVFLRLAAKNHGWEFLNRAFLAQHAENSGYMTDDWLRSVTSGIPGVTPADLARRDDATVAAGIAQAEAYKHALMKLGDGTPFFSVGRTGQPLSTYRRVDLAAKGSAADSITAAVAAAQRR